MDLSQIIDIGFNILMNFQVNSVKWQEGGFIISRAVWILADGLWMFMNVY